MKRFKEALIPKARVGRGLAATVMVCAAIGGGTAGVGVQSMGAWPKWLGGSYVSTVGCECKNYANFGGHWVACPVRSLWGMNNTGTWSTPEIHLDATCDDHGH
ncbi:hypothetical protein [Phaeocystidibacter luteus]|uniref:Uncharacterized protein n=1 Tax=Phaeocystidibacter luteus TaxID=911197 RepID=A0A6N6RMQ5_9FLAO|nr:hypothetical protein [Phaeocystidibacter luteus]KAB2814828.1 hypothetical protein F8C67_03505 [Phaeocystidibacter luteus]